MRDSRWQCSVTCPAPSASQAGTGIKLGEDLRADTVHAVGWSNAPVGEGVGETFTSMSTQAAWRREWVA